MMTRIANLQQTANSIRVCKWPLTGKVRRYGPLERAVKSSSKKPIVARPKFKRSKNRRHLRASHLHHLTPGLTPERPCPYRLGKGFKITAQRAPFNARANAFLFFQVPEHTR